MSDWQDRLAEMVKKAEMKARALREAEEVSKLLPTPVMPREAVELKREQLRKLDEHTKE